MERNSYFQSVNNFKDKQVIKVFTGMRRCGKSVLMEQYIQKLRNEGISDSQIPLYMHL